MSVEPASGQLVGRIDRRRADVDRRQRVLLGECVLLVRVDVDGVASLASASSSGSGTSSPVRLPQAATSHDERRKEQAAALYA